VLGEKIDFFLDEPSGVGYSFSELAACPLAPLVGAARLGFCGGAK
jgi:hypothetical protein